MCVTTPLYNCKQHRFLYINKTKILVLTFGPQNTTDIHLKKKSPRICIFYYHLVAFFFVRGGGVYYLLLFDSGDAHIKELFSIS